MYTVDDLDVAEVRACPWAGDGSHLRLVEAEVRRAGAGGEVEYLAVRPRPGGPVLGIGALDLARDPGCGFIHQVVVAPARRRRGVASALMDALEDATLRAGRGLARLTVEAGERPAMRLHLTRGYHDTGRSVVEHWDYDTADGPITHAAHCHVLEKALPWGPSR